VVKTDFLRDSQIFAGLSAGRHLFLTELSSIFNQKLTIDSGTASGLLWVINDNLINLVALFLHSMADMREETSILPNQHNCAGKFNS
jgi:hypothetical protein